jgi:hypothetical protein
MHHRKQKKLAALQFLHQRPIGGGIPSNVLSDAQKHLLKAAVEFSRE